MQCMLQNQNKPIGTGAVAARLGVSSATVTRWVKRGRLRSLGHLTDSPKSPLQFDPDEVERVRSALAELGEVAS